MRPVLPLLLATWLASGCSCTKASPATPTPVNFVFTNTSSAPLVIDASDSTFGLVVTPQGAVDTAPAYLEALPAACSCLSCDVVCTNDGCPGSPPCQASPPSNPLLELLAPGAAVQRTWSGVYQRPTQQSCSGLGTEACLQQTNAGPDDTFTARICYALSLPGGQAADAGVPFPGTLPSGGVVCATQDFQPSQGTVNLTPPAPTPCTDDAGSCSTGALCLSGTCTSGCPENDFPAYGGAYVVYVGTPSGVFFLQSSTSTSTVSSGTGTLTSVSYSGGGTTLSLSTDAGFTGAVQLTLPQLADCCLEAYHPGETLSVRVVESPPGSGNRAIVIRDDTGQLIQLADMAANGPVLGATDTAPFTVAASASPLGCTVVASGCKAVYSGTVFSTPEGAAPLVSPGEFVSLSTSGANFGVLNVTSTSYQSSLAGACTPYTPLSPYLILNARL